MLVVLIIVAMYMSIVFMLLFFVKNEWCDILNKNLTVKNKTKVLLGSVFPMKFALERDLS